MITLIFGPMFSGKTTYLLSYERRFLIAKKSVLLVKWSKDTRYSEHRIVTHNGEHNQSKSIVSVGALSSIPYELLHNTECILIDEGQFFPDLMEWCQAYEHRRVAGAEVIKRHIVIAGLSGDYKQQSFEPITAIIPIADHIIHLKSICSVCAADAPFTVRTSHETAQTVIGNDDKYQPRCKDCLESVVTSSPVANELLQTNSAV